MCGDQPHARGRQRSDNDQRANPRDGSRYRDGLVRAPTEPGLGAHIDFGLIERKKVGVLS